MTRCPNTHPDGRRCLLPTHAHGKHLVASPGRAPRDVQLRLVTAWAYPAAIREQCVSADATAEDVAGACEVMSNLMAPYLRRSALPPISPVVGEA